MNRLPKDIQNLIYQYDPTHKDNFELVLRELVERNKKILETDIVITGLCKYFESFCENDDDEFSLLEIRVHIIEYFLESL